MKRLGLIFAAPFVIGWHCVKSIPWAQIYFVFFVVVSTLLFGKKTKKKLDNDTPPI